MSNDHFYKFWVIVVFSHKLSNKLKHLILFFAKVN